jgi:hypothetical protein
MRVLLAASLALATATSAFMQPAIAAEGMWTLDNLPTAAMQTEFDFSPDQEWVQKVMRSSVRLAGGCSGSFISGDGLVLTNHHCIVGCIGDLSSETEDLMRDGFVAADRAQERQCPNFELNRLESTSDVSERVREATKGLSGKAFADAKRATQSAIESECVGDDSAKRRCDVVDLYQGGVQHLYQYARFQDVRLAFAPEFAAGFFGGDPDNFNFPRYNLDMGLLRAYVDGKPAEIEDFFPMNPAGAEEGELVMISGHPGSTQRMLTVAQLEALRDRTLLDRLLYLAEMRGLLLQFGALGEEQARQAQNDLFGVENSFKALRGRLSALNDAAVFDGKRAQEAALRAFAAAHPTLAEEIGQPWDDIAQATATFADIETAYGLLEGGRGFGTDFFGHARTLVRGAAERAKPNAERLREFADAGLPRVEQGLFAEQPIYPAYEQVKLGWTLSKLREQLGADHPVVKQTLGKESPQQLAARLVEGTSLGDVAVRRALWEGGIDAVMKSNDPMIALARTIDPLARELRDRYEREVQAVVQKSAEAIAKVRFAKEGTGVYPDATFSLRLSFGAVEGWQHQGQTVPAMTYIGGLYERATGAEPFKLAPTWVAAREQLNLELPMNFVSSNDIIGGNSGSPVINAKAEVVGLVFDGNIHSLGGAYWYDGRLNRAVSVHSAAMIEALRKVYPAQHLADEILAR